MGMTHPQVRENFLLFSKRSLIFKDKGSLTLQAEGPILSSALLGISQIQREFNL